MVQSNHLYDYEAHHCVDHWVCSPSVHVIGALVLAFLMYSPTTAQIILLANHHIDRYANMLAFWRRGEKGINAEETYRYLFIWQDIKDKEGLDLTDAEMGEVIDAVMSGDFDSLIGITQADYDRFGGDLSQDPTEEDLSS